MIQQVRNALQDTIWSVPGLRWHNPQQTPTERKKYLKATVIRAVRREPDTRAALRRINPDGVNQFTQKQLAERWGVTLRTVQRDLRRYGAQAFDVIGIMPVFALDVIEAVETKRAAKRSQQLGLEPKKIARVMTMAELKQRKGKARR
jgi:hypothetical protein